MKRALLVSLVIALFSSTVYADEPIVLRNYFSQYLKYYDGSGSRLSSDLFSLKEFEIVLRPNNQARTVKITAFDQKHYYVALEYDEYTPVFLAQEVNGGPPIKIQNLTFYFSFDSSGPVGYSNLAHEIKKYDIFLNSKHPLKLRVVFSGYELLGSDDQFSSVVQAHINFTILSIEELK